MANTLASAELDLLVIAAQKGDPQAFHALVVAVQRELHLVLCSFAPPPELLEELVQDTLVTAWEKLGTYRPEGTFVAWLHAIARNKARSRWRASRRTRYVDKDTLDVLLAEAESEILSDEAAAEADTSRLAECLEQLPVRTRQLLQRRYVDGISLCELGRELRRSESALAALFYRLRGKLRECMTARTAS